MRKKSKFGLSWKIVILAFWGGRGKWVGETRGWRGGWGGGGGWRENSPLLGFEHMVATFPLSSARCDKQEVVFLMRSLSNESAPQVWLDNFRLKSRRRSDSFGKSFGSPRSRADSFHLCNKRRRWSEYCSKDGKFPAIILWNKVHDNTGILCKLLAHSKKTEYRYFAFMHW